MSSAARALALVALAGALAGCETTAEKSAKLEKVALAKLAAKHAKVIAASRPSRYVKVASADVVRGREGAALVVTLRNSSPRSQFAVPLGVTVKEGAATEYTNKGAAPTLTQVPSIAGHGEATWVDDQVTLTGKGRAVATIRVGEGTAGPAAVPSLTVQGAQLGEEGGEATVTGKVHNASQVAQHELVVYAVARRGSTVVGAGRAVLSSVAVGATTSFQIFMIGSGSEKGAQLQVLAPASSSH